MSEAKLLNEQKQDVSAGVEALCMFTADGNCDFKPRTFMRRAVGPNDVLIDMKYCGVCHSDLHTAAGHIAAVMPAKYPCVPGHELSGVCVQVGDNVTKFKVGDLVRILFFRSFCLLQFSNSSSLMNQDCLTGWCGLHG